MKMIHVYGDEDYSALDFREKNKGKTVNEFLEDFSGQDRIETEDFFVDIYDFSDIDPAFIRFVREQIEDYDASKHATFLFGEDTI